MSRMYYAPIVVGAHGAQVDYLEILAGANKPIRIHEFEFGQSSEVGDAQEEMLTILVKRVTGAPTPGSGGTTTVGIPADPNDIADAATVVTGSTTKLSGGTSVEMFRFNWNIRQPYLWLPPPEGRILIDQATRFVLEEATTPADSITGPVGRVLYEELI